MVQEIRARTENFLRLCVQQVKILSLKPCTDLTFAPSLTSIFAGLVSYGISFSKNNNFASWRIFLLTIGLFTVAAGAVVFVYLPDSPVKAKRFTDAEKVAVLLRVADNQSGTQNSKIKTEQLRVVFKDPGVWLVMISVLMLSVPTSIPNFSSILLTTFGYTPQQAVSDAQNPLLRIGC